MSKAVLVIDIPSSCEECPLSLEIEGQYNVNICRGCKEYTLNSNSKEKLNSCPLKENYEQEIRNKVIEEFAKRLKQKYPIAENGFGFINDKLRQ